MKTLAYNRIFFNSNLFVSFLSLYKDIFRFFFFLNSMKTEVKHFGLISIPLLSSSDFLFLSSSSIKIFLSQKKYFNTFFSLIRSFFNFLQFGYFVDLTLKGKGFYNFSFSNFVVLELGYSHRVLVPIPEEVIFKKFKYRLGFFSFNFEKLFNFVHVLLNLKRLNIYKGKGIFFRTTNLKLKVGKKR